MREQGSRVARVLIVIGCLWLAVGGIAVAAHVGLRWTIDQLPARADGGLDIARAVLGPVRDVLLPILLVALALGALVQSVKLLLSLARRRAAADRRSG